MQTDAKKLQAKLRGKSQIELSIELQKQLNYKFSEIISVIKALNRYDYKRDFNEAQTIWQEGSSRLLSFACDSDKTVIFIPSLINKSYIMDLSEKRSFMRYLQKSGINAYLVDWSEPLQEELGFNLDDYIAGRLDKIISFVWQKTKKPIILAGYCMGGLLSLASALRNQDKVVGLALFATPWDFHSDDFRRFNLNEEGLKSLEVIINSSPKISASIIQSMFYYLHPESVRHKFDNFFAFINNKQSDIEEFLAIEHWVNDGISMPSGLAKNCFIHWEHNNDVCKLKWQVAGNIVNPEQLKIPTFIASSNMDHIVPKECSSPLFPLIKNKTLVKSSMGHISIIAGSRAKEKTWQPFEKWVKSAVV